MKGNIEIQAAKRVVNDSEPEVRDKEKTTKKRVRVYTDDSKAKKDGTSKSVKLAIEDRNLESFDTYTKEAKEKKVPLLFLRNNSDKKSEKFLPALVIPESVRLGYGISDKNFTLANDKKAEDFDLFLIYPPNKKEILLGNIASLLSKKGSPDSFFCSAISFDPTSQSKKSLTALAGLFHAGVVFPKNKAYAQDLLQKIGDNAIAKTFLVDNLVYSAQFEQYIPHLKSFFELGADINQQSSTYGYALPTALFHGNFEAADFLTNAGASLTTRDYRYGSAEELLHDIEKTDSE